MASFSIARAEANYLCTKQFGPASSVIRNADGFNTRASLKGGRLYAKRYLGLLWNEGRRQHNPVHKLSSHKSKLLERWKEGDAGRDSDSLGLSSGQKRRTKGVCMALSGRLLGPGPDSGSWDRQGEVNGDENVSGRCKAQALARAAFIGRASDVAGAPMLARTLEAGSVWAQRSIALLKKAQRVHPKIFASVAVLVLIGYLTRSTFATPNVQLTILALGVAILGVPHGALDLVTAQGLMRDQKWPWPHEWNLTLFLAAYTACTASVVYLWWQFPGPSLAGLLAASAWHFGTNDAQGLLPGPWHWAEVAARGFGPITLPFILHREETTVLFSHLAPPIAAGHVAQLCTLLAFPTALAVAITCTYSYVRARVKPEDDVPANRGSEDNNSLSRSRGDLCLESVKLVGSQKASGSEAKLSRESRLASALEMLLLGVGCTVAPPLLGFFLAFCTLHSLRHTLAFFADEETPAHLADLCYVGKAAGLVTAVTLAASLAIFAGLLKHPVIASHVASLQMASVQVIFVGLAALTAPHMMLLEISRHQRKHARPCEYG